MSDGDDLLARMLNQKFGCTHDDIDAIFSGLSIDPLPSAGALAIYLDLNHWVSLAKASIDRHDGQEFISILNLLRRAVKSRNVFVPLSATHYMEVTKIANVRQRTDIANVMSEISHFITLASPAQRLDFEIAAALGRRYSRLPAPSPLQPIGVGFSFAFGLRDGPMGRVKLVDAGKSETEAGVIAELEFSSNQIMEYMVLRGPGDGDIAEMEEYDRYAAQRVATERAESEQRKRELIRAGDARGISLDDVVHARMMAWYVVPQLPMLLSLAGVSKESFGSRDKQWYTNLLEDIPMIAVQSALIIQTDKNGSRAWSANDINDMDSLGAAVPYCDIVVTERYACEVLNRSGVAQRYNTRVMRSLTDLKPILEGLLGG